MNLSFKFNLDFNYRLKVNLINHKNKKNVQFLELFL